MSNSINVPSLSELLAQLDMDEGKKSPSSSSTSSSPYTIENFEAFLRRSHCEENYEFWKCSNYYLSNSDKRTFDFVKWNTKIYENFIKENASMECNLPEEIRKAYTDWYLHSIIPNRDIVLRARQHAFNLMTDAYRQFVRYLSTCSLSPSTPAVSVKKIENVYINTSTSSSSQVIVEDQQDVKVRSIDFVDNGINDFKLNLTRSPTSKSANGECTRSNSMSSSATSSHSDAIDTASSSTNKLLIKGKAFVNKLTKKTRRPTLTSSSSSSSNTPFYSHLKRGVSDRTLDEAR